MRSITILRATFVAAIVAASTICVAHAPAYAQAQAQSNMMLDGIANRINQDIAALNGDDTDYGGHRIVAIGHMRRAHNQIAAAERFAATHGLGADAANPGGAAPMAQGGVRRQQYSSDDNIIAVRNDLNALLNQMRSGMDDYGGHRTAAANELGIAVNELGLALAYRHGQAPPIR